MSFPDTLSLLAVSMVEWSKGQVDFHILTIFPDVLRPYFEESILGRAQKEGRIKIFCHDLRNYAHDRNRKVDDRPYGGGSGMIFKPDVLVEGIRDLKKKHSIGRVILLSPRGRLFSQKMAEDFSRLDSFLLVCGRYEGVDQRAIDLVVDEEISIGDYVISGGELAAQVVVDATARQVPGVLGNEEATLQESHRHGLLEYPQYTRPSEFEGLKVPDILLSGDHQGIEKWRQEESLRITKKNRPDLIKFKI